MFALTLLCTLPITLYRISFFSGLASISNLSKKLDDTATRAASGHGKNQSMLVQLKSAGNFCARSTNQESQVRRIAAFIQVPVGTDSTVPQMEFKCGQKSPFTISAILIA